MSAENNPKIEELEGSELGTKEYWEKCYTTEIKNYKSHGDVGEVWFEEDSQIRIINWMLKIDSIKSEDSIVDLGSGNGMMLIELAREDFKNLTGIDYSPKAIELSINIAKDQELNIKYKVSDLASSDDVSELGLFKIAHDKGTYDAVSLDPENTKEKRETYIRNVHKILEENGILIITSCNWTQPELIEAFEGKFKIKCSIPTPTFMFGGKVGNVVTSVVFERI